MTDFRSLGLADPLLAALAAAGHAVPTAIQGEAIPPILRGSDLVGIAQTGTGKTAAFALPILHRLLQSPDPARPRQCRSLILSPTRELASQIADTVRLYARRTGLRTATLVGGVPRPPQSRAVAGGTDIVVATPGRLLDHLSGRTLVLDETRILVLDEADHMLDLGFAADVDAIAALLPRRHQTLLFSATMPPAIATLARRLLHDPVQVSATPQASAPPTIEQRVIFAEPAQKRAVLIELLRRNRFGRTLVFTGTRQNADAVVAALDQAGIRAAAIHGDKSQPQRERILADFRGARLGVLVATDIAARGIDVEGLTHVVNYDLPAVPETYIHRIGRTARAGAGGLAISLCGAADRQSLRAIETLLGRRLRVIEPRARLGD